MNERTLDRDSKIAQIIYAAAAVLNIMVFFYFGHRMDNLAVAALFGCLILNQRAVDGWRHAARAWRDAAEAAERRYRP